MLMKFVDNSSKFLELVLEAGNPDTLPESLNSYFGVELASISEGSS